MSALQALSQVVEPDVRVLVIGEVTSLDFYREVTRGMGAREYLPKPLTRDAVMRLFAPVIAGKQVGTEELSGGRVITITGARGGVGASTIAVNLAWHFGVACSRHTVLLDPDLHSGTAAMYVDAPTGPGLRAALEMPDRIDDSVRGTCRAGAGRPPARAGRPGTDERAAGLCTGCGAAAAGAHCAAATILSSSTCRSIRFRCIATSWIWRTSA